MDCYRENVIEQNLLWPNSGYNVATIEHLFVLDKPNLLLWEVRSAQLQNTLLLTMSTNLRIQVTLASIVYHVI